MERLNAINGDSFQPFRPLNCGSAMLLLFLFFFSFSCNFFFFFCLCVWQVCCCGTFICLSLMAVSHYHNTKLPTIERECLFNQPGHSSSPCPACLFGFASLSCVSSRHWPGSCAFPAFGLQSKSRVEALCQVILSLGKSATGHGKMALTCLHAGSDGWLPVSAAALVAQGPLALVLSETRSCPNGRQCDMLLFISTQIRLQINTKPLIRRFI